MLFNKSLEEMKKSIFIFLMSIVILSDSCAEQKNTGTKVRFETTSGKITVLLYSKTTKHHDNFVKLVNEGFYNGVLFHRVIAGFMIQAGDPESKAAKPGADLGSGDVGYTIPAEFIYPEYYHKRGALCAAREGDEINPLKASSGCQFYIVVGRTFSDSELDNFEAGNKIKLQEKLFHEIVDTKLEEVKKYRKEHNQMKLDALRDSVLEVVKVKMEKNTSFKFTQQQRSDYKTIGGTPHLDGEYTVYGEVTEGLDIIEKMSKVKTGSNDRPVVDIKVIKAEVLK
jgi:cyclophilin family peptidyl-prolyl cis-trans isomerase